jgi:hypothetical protein
MTFKSRTLSLATVLLVLCWAGSAQAQYLLTGNSGGEVQIGTGLPLPVGTQGIFLGGMTPVNGGTSCGGGPGGCSVSPDGPGTAYWPPLFVPPNPNVSTGGAATRTIMQNGATTMGGTITVPPAALSQPAAGAPVPIALFPTNPAVFQVATSISYEWPAATAVLAPGGAPGPAVLGTAGAGGLITYSGGTKAFGGAGQFAIAPGPGAGSARVPPNGAGVRPVASVWINFAGALPTTVMTVGVVGASNPLGLGNQGAPVTLPAGMTSFGPVLNSAMTAPNGIGVVNVTTGGTPMNPVCCTVGPLGTIPSSIQPGAAFPSNMVTGSKGFPWTTGFITISQPGAVPPEIFFLSGTDMRVAGVGNVSLVSGSLSERALSGPNANRGWVSLTLPEPSAALGTAGALAMLGLCHGLVRRRSR